MNDDEIEFDDLYYRHELQSWYEKVKTRQTLIERIQNNPDEKSWGEFTHFYAEFIYNTVRSMGLSHHDSEDLRQQVMLKAWKGIEKVEYDPAKHKFRSWMSTITKNTVRNFFAKKSTRKQNQENNLDTTFGPELLSDSEIDSITEREWRIYISKLALEAISKRFSEKTVSVFEAFLEGKSGEEVAIQCDLNINTVYSYKIRVQNAVCKEIIRLNEELG